MKRSSVTLDRVLYRILMDEMNSSFTVMELRSAYVKHVDVKGMRMADVRLYLYDQLRKLIGHGWVAYAVERKSRGQRFVCNELPEGVTVKAVPPGRGIVELGEKQEVDRKVISPTRVAEEESHSIHLVQEMLKSARLDFLTALGETERYKQLIEDVPALQMRLSKHLVDSRDKSSKLLGHINALEVALHEFGSSK